MKFLEFIEINPKVELRKGLEYPCVLMDEVEPGNKWVSGNIIKPYKGGTKFQKGDTLFARITPCLENGKIAKYKGEKNKQGFGSTEFFVFRAKEGISDEDYVYYLSLSNIIRKPAEASMFGASGRQRADLDFVQNIQINPPNLETQRKIAAILSAYDDLIENNTRRIKILEEIAQRLYSEWFVHFRYPGHENVKMVYNEELGQEIPEGWEVKKFSDVVEINPVIKTNKNEEYPFVLMADVSTNSLIVECNSTRFGGSGSKFQNFDVIFPRITPSVEHGKGGFVLFLQDCQIAKGSTEFIVFRSKNLCPEMIYFLSKEPEFRENAVKSMIGASGRQRVKNECFDNFLLAKPDQSTIEKYSQIGKTIIKEIYLLSKKNKLLRQARDLLLPRLISVEFDLDKVN